MDLNTQKKDNLSLFPLIMIAVISVDSLRNIPIGAQYGLSLITFYIAAGLLFFLPLAWITSQLATQFPNTGGSYLWIRAAFGQSYGTLGMWLQWLYNMIWYPTIFAFATGTLAVVIAPHLETSKWFILMSSLGFFWLITWLHTYGIKALSLISTPSAILGALLPMVLIIAFAGYWLITGHPSATPFTLQSLIPSQKDLHNLGFFSNILFSLLGLEVIAMHAEHVTNPSKIYPRALWISALIILISIVLSSLALCIILPANKIDLVDGIMHVFQTFFATYHITHVALFIGLCIVIGSLGIASSWMLGTARGLHVALKDMNGPAWLLRLNKNQIPVNVLLMQSVVYTALLSLFLLFPDINSFYWILSAITAQFALLYYVLIFSAAFKLLKDRKQKKLNQILNRVLPCMAVIVCLFGIIVGFFPPELLETGNNLAYKLMMITAFLVTGLLPVFLINHFQTKQSRHC